jgi:HSP20 family protein
MATAGQIVAIRIYQTDDRIMLAAPMPGLEPEDISLVIDGRHVTLHGRERGPHQHDRDLLVAEWAVGPYHREVDLPEPVAGDLTNVTFENGVLVLSMPKAREAASGGAPGPIAIELEAVTPTRGERVGHVGRRIIPSTTAEHRRDKHPGPRA